MPPSSQNPNEYDETLLKAYYNAVRDLVTNAPFIQSFSFDLTRFDFSGSSYSQTDDPYFKEIVQCLPKSIETLDLMTVWKKEQVDLLTQHFSAVNQASFLVELPLIASDLRRTYQEKRDDLVEDPTLKYKHKAAGTDALNLSEKALNNYLSTSTSLVYAQNTKPRDYDTQVTDLIHSIKAFQEKFPTAEITVYTDHCIRLGYQDLFEQYTLTCKSNTLFGRYKSR